MYADRWMCVFLVFLEFVLNTQGQWQDYIYNIFTLNSQ